MKDEDWFNMTDAFAMTVKFLKDSLDHIKEMDDKCECAEQTATVFENVLDDFEASLEHCQQLDKEIEMLESKIRDMGK